MEHEGHVRENGPSARQTVAEREQKVELREIHFAEAWLYNQGGVGARSCNAYVRADVHVQTRWQGGCTGGIRGMCCAQHGQCPFYARMGSARPGGGMQRKEQQGGRLVAAARDHIED